MGSWVGSATALATDTTSPTTASMLHLKRQQTAQLQHPTRPTKAAITTDTATVMATDPAGQDKPSYFFLLLKLISEK